jgi:MFS family permease
MKKILIFSFFLDFITNGIIANCWIAIFSREGFSLSEAAVACGFMCLSTAFFELPTGYLADRFLGRKGSVLVGMLLIGVGMLVLGLSDRFLVSALAMVVTGLGTTFISGAKQAWLRNVVADRYPNRLKKFFFDIDIGGRIATILGIWASAYLIEHQTPSAPWLMGALACGFCLICAFLIPKGSSDQDNKNAAILIETAGIGKYLGRPILLFVLMSTAFLGIEDAIRGIIFQPVVLKLGSDNAMVLAYQATITLGPRLFGAFSYRNFFSKYPRPFQILTGSIIGIATLEIGISQVNSYLVFAVMWSVVVFLLASSYP